MPDARTFFDKPYLAAFDLDNRDVTVTIESVSKGKLVGTGGKTAQKPIIKFVGKEKGLAANITNIRIIAAMYGGFATEKWIGKQITLYATKVQFGPDVVDAIRVRPTIPTGKPATATQEPDK